MLSERARRILGLIAEGRSYDQILQQHPELTYFDIFAAAREALETDQATPSVSVRGEQTRAEGVPPPGPTGDVISVSGTPPLPDPAPGLRDDPSPAAVPILLPDASPKRVSFIERARATHGRAFTRWSPDEDMRLEALFRAGTPRREISRQLDRHEGAITRRLEKLGLIEPAEQSLARTRRAGRPSRSHPEEVPPRAETPADRPSVPGWDLFRNRLSDDPPP